MFTIVYASRATRHLDETALTELLAAARSANSRADVSGMLIYAHDSFMQQLEGDEATLKRIFASIAKDKRHTDIRVLSMRVVSQRRYEGWSMGFEHPDTETLSERFPGFRPASGYPLVHSQLVADTEMAETVLALAATSGTVTGR